MSRENNGLVQSLLTVGLALLLAYSPAGSADWLDSMSDWFDENMIDAEDGKVDISDYLSGARGFFPVPIIITEPAVGFGVGAAVAIFAGGGHTTSVDAFSADSETVAAGGLGFRYRIARKLGMQVGMDVARGPEETAFYLTVGSAW